MIPVRVTASSSDPVTLEVAKDHCRIDAGITDFDTLLGGMVKSATLHMENRLGYGLVTQTWRQFAANFRSPIVLGRRPRSAEPVVVKYFDGANVQQTISAGVTEFDGVVSFSGDLPAVYDRPDAVSIDYQVGVAVEVIPADLKAALLIHIAFMFANRESQTEKEWHDTGAYGDLIHPYRLNLV